MLSQPDRAVGRPSVASERREEILDAFIELISEHGLEAVTLDEVAARAGVQRSAIRHFVGNRTSLITEASSRLVDRYERIVRRAVGESPSLAQLVDHLFSPEWATQVSVEDRAFDELFREAARNAETRDRLRRAYELLIDEIAAAIGRHQPGRPHPAARHAAYQVVCLAEYNAVLQQLGLAAAHARAARRAALDLAVGAER